jgi:hypothetical protein
MRFKIRNDTSVTPPRIHDSTRRRKEGNSQWVCSTETATTDRHHHQRVALMVPYLAVRPISASLIFVSDQRRRREGEGEGEIATSPSCHTGTSARASAADTKRFVSICISINRRCVFFPFLLGFVHLAMDSFAARARTHTAIRCLQLQDDRCMGDALLPLLSDLVCFLIRIIIHPWISLS